jgi:hypothetical protein
MSTHLMAAVLGRITLGLLGHGYLSGGTAMVAVIS